MRSIFTLAVVLVAVTNGSNLDLDTEWENFKVSFDRNFAVQEEHNLRQSIFNENLKFIEKHNAEHALGLHTYTLGINQFTDMTTEEFVQQYNNLQSPSKNNVLNVVEDADITSLPKSIDYRKEGYVTPVKDQGKCGTCWAFSAVVALEGAHAKKTGNLVSLSEQQLIECITVRNRPLTCSQGSAVPRAIGYVIQYGIDTEKSYPYNATELSYKEDHSIPLTCQFNKADVGATFTDLKMLDEDSETQLQNAIANYGPVSVGIDANHKSFQLYKSGVYNEPQCSSRNLDHGVGIVGYGTTENGDEYYIVKNSYGASWGEEGYIKMARNKGNQCGIASAVSIAIA